MYCVDVLKSHMQTCEEGKYKGLVDCAQQLLKKEGPSVFFVGFLPAIFRAFFLHSIIFSVYESTLRILE